jgi:DNA mismatch repair protein MLH1
LISGGVSQFREPGSELSQVRRVYENRLVRTDPNQVKLTAFTKEVTPADNSDLDVSNPSSDLTWSGLNAHDNISSEYRPVKLTSIKTLRKQVEATLHNALTNVFMNHTFVGIVDYNRRLAAIQHDVNLYLVDYGGICKELFYQIGLADFANFGKIEFDESLSINDMLEASHCSEDEIKQLNALLSDKERRNMLFDYFSCQFVQSDDGILLKSLPLLLSNYTPPFSKLPLFLKKLVSINWDDELCCLDGILRELSLLYIPLPLENEEDVEVEEMQLTLEKTIFPTLKNRLVATQELQSYVIEIANLPGLYKVFERC